MTDQTTQKISIPDDDDVTMVISTQDMARKISGSGQSSGETTVAFTSPGLFRFFGRKLRNVGQEIDRENSVPAPAAADADDGGVPLKDDRDLPELAERYQVLRLLAEGGQARVSLAVDRCLGRQVAVKSMRQELLKNTAARDDFLAESRVTASLDHPSIVPVYSLNSDPDGGLHLAMKLMTGKTLKQYLADTVEKYRKDGVVHFDEAAALTYRLEIFLKVCDALAYVHDHKVIHCDLKPENIMIGHYHETYIMDWGIARSVSEAPADKHQTMGTPRYTSPENLLGQPCDTRSDIYTMGVILYELATLSPAFPDTDLTRVIHQVRRGNIAPLVHRFGTPIHRDLAAIIRKTTALDPARRYRHISELAADIRHFIRREEVSANPDGVWGKMARFTYRHRRVVLLLAALGFVGSITVALLGTWWNIMNNAVAEQRRDLAITRAVLGARRTALAISDQFIRLEHLLELVEAETLLLLQHRMVPESADGTMVPMDDKGKLPDAYQTVYAPYQSSLSCAGFRSMKTDPVEVQQQLLKIQPLFPRLRATLLNGPVPGDPMAPPDDPAYRTMLVKQDRMPVRSVLVALADGLQVIYPASTGHESYDGRTRPWYQAGMQQAGKNSWGTPYIDFGSEGHFVISCSRMIGDRLGVAALDVPLHFLVERMQAEPPPYLLERMMVDAAGRVVVATSAAGNWQRVPIRSSGGEWVPQIFEEQSLLKQMREKQIGALFSVHDGKTVLWCFWLIRSLNWLYIEKMDYNQLWDLCQP